MLGALALLCGCPSAAGTTDAATDAASCSPASSETSCRSNADCEGLISCIAPDERAACGLCVMATRLCESDADCSGASDVCVETFEPCAVCNGQDGRGTQCVPSCLETGCARGDACDAQGHCVPIRCGRDYECPLGTSCDDDPSAGDAHGCVRASCATDADCPCGTGCVEGRCFVDLGLCVPASP